MKGVIVITDIPKNCAGCDYSHCIEGNFRCVINDTSVRDHVSYQTKPKWCPIKTYDIDEIVKQLGKHSFIAGDFMFVNLDTAIKIVKGGAE